MVPLPGSPAIDAGDNTDAPIWDQRGPGFRRIVKGIIDIGAFEVQARAYNRPTRQPFSDPVPVQGLPSSPSLGQPPALTADPFPLPDPPLVPTDSGNPAPAPFLPAAVDTGQRVGPLGPSGTGDFDPLALALLGGP
jgi:hypothetical protein